MAQWKSDLYVSDTAAAEPASLPPIVPSFGAVAGTVKTRGSLDGESPLEGRFAPLGNST